MLEEKMQIIEVNVDIEILQPDTVDAPNTQAGPQEGERG